MGVRRLLLVCTGLVVGGAALAQTAITYTSIGEGIVNAFLIADDATISDWIANGNTGLESTLTLPVEWVVDGEYYSGEIAVEDGSQLVPALVQFYTITCLTANQADCGRLRKAVDPLVEPETDTSTDEWYNYDANINGFVFPESLPQGNPAKRWIVENYCDNGTQRKTAGTASYAWGGPPVNQFKITRGQGVGASGSPSLNSVVTGGIEGTDNSTNRSGVASLIMSEFLSACPHPSLYAWETGSYYAYNEMPGVHDDVPEGFRIAMSQLAAEFDRRAMYGWLPLGLTFDPEPTTEQLAGEAPDPGDGGGGGTTIVEPGNCEEGWFLTQLVCEIRDIANTFWEFISHDAWVPEVGLVARMEAVQEDAEGRFPFSVVASGELGAIEEHLTVHTGEWECPSVSVNTGEWLTGLVPSGVLTEAEVEPAEWNICDNPYAEWMHEDGRQFIALIFGFLAAWRIARSVMGTGS